MPRPDMRKQQLETEKKKRSTTTGNSTQDEEEAKNNVPPPVDDNKKKNNAKNKTKKSNSMSSIEENQMNQANSTLITSSSSSNSTTATEASTSSSSETIFSKAIKGFTFFKQKNLESQEDQDTGNDNSKSDTNSNKSIRGQTSPSQAPTIMIHNNNDYSNDNNNLQQQQTIPNCTSSYISCYSQTHPAFTIAIINTVFLFLYYIFCSKRKYSRKWRPHNKTRDARGEYSAVQVYDTLLDDFDDGQFSVSSSVYDNGDDSSESIGSVISQWSDIGNASRGGRSKSGTRSVEMTIMGDDHLAMEEMNG